MMCGSVPLIAFAPAPLRVPDGAEVAPDEDPPGSQTVGMAEGPARRSELDDVRRLLALRIGRLDHDDPEARPDRRSTGTSRVTCRRSPVRRSKMTSTPVPESNRSNSSRSCGVDVFLPRPLESGFPLPSAGVTSVLHGQDAHFVSLLGPRGREGDREGLGIPAPTPANPHRL